MPGHVGEETAPAMLAPRETQGESLNVLLALLMSVSTGEPTLTLSHVIDIQGRISAIVGLPPNRLAICTVIDELGGDDRLQVYDLAREALVASVPGPCAHLVGAGGSSAFIIASGDVVTRDGAAQIRRLDLSGETLVVRWQILGDADGMALSADRQLLAVNEKGALAFRRVANGKLLRRVKVRASEGAPAFSHDGKWAVVSSRYGPAAFLVRVDDGRTHAIKSATGTNHDKQSWDPFMWQPGDQKIIGLGYTAYAEIDVAKRSLDWPVDGFGGDVSFVVSDDEASVVSLDHGPHGPDDHPQLFLHKQGELARVALPGPATIAAFVGNDAVVAIAHGPANSRVMRVAVAAPARSP